MDFQKRLKSAIQRGQQHRAQRDSADRQQQLTLEELKNLHSSMRLELSERIEECFQQLIQHLPGFRFETMYGERGWGAACFRNDIHLRRGAATKERYSRLEMTVRPLNDYQVLDLAAKATVADKEIFNRNFFQLLEDAKLADFQERIDLWTAEFAERYAAHA